MYAGYNPIAPFSKGEFCRDAPAGRLYSPLIKGESGGCHTHHVNCYHFSNTCNVFLAVSSQLKRLALFSERCLNSCNKIVFDNTAFIFSAISCGLKGSKYLAASCHISGIGSIFDDKIVAPQAIASTRVIPKDSHVDGYTNNLQSTYKKGTSS